MPFNFRVPDTQLPLLGVRKVLRDHVDNSGFSTAYVRCLIIASCAAWAWHLRNRRATVQETAPCFLIFYMIQLIT